MSDRLRLVFLGSGAFGVPSFERLVQEHDVAMVVTQPDKPAGRGGKLRPTPISQAAAETDCRIFKPEQINEAGAVDQVRGLEADAWVVIAYGQKLGRRLLDDVFAINLHASLLPRWRGAAPIHHAVLAGDAETGNSVITLADEMDAGDVLATTSRLIEPSQTTGDLHDLLAADGPDAVLRTLSSFAAGTLSPITQNRDLVTLAPKLTREAARVDFTSSADVCRRTINGLSPWPGCAAMIDGIRVKLLRAGPADGSGLPGSLLDSESGRVACGNSAIRLLEVQPEGKRAMPFEDFSRGRSFEPGTMLEDIAGHGG